MISSAEPDAASARSVDALVSQRLPMKSGSERESQSHSSMSSGRSQSPLASVASGSVIGRQTGLSEFMTTSVLCTATYEPPSTARLKTRKPSLLPKKSFLSMPLADIVNVSVSRDCPTSSATTVSVAPLPVPVRGRVKLAVGGRDNLSDAALALAERVVVLFVFRLAVDVHHVEAKTLKTLKVIVQKKIESKRRIQIIQL
jgi:hypothetical protein